MTPANAAGTDAGASDRAVLLGALATNGLAYTCYNLASFLVLDRVTTTTHAVLNVFRRVAVISVTTLVFAVPIRAANVLGISLAVAGIAAFSISKAQAKPGKDDDARLDTRDPLVPKSSNARPRLDS